MACGDADVLDDGADDHLEPDGAITALGTGGSNRIRSAILQVASNLLDRGMGLEEAVEAPRLHVERDGTLSFEPGLPPQVARAFAALGEGRTPGPSAICSSAACTPRGATERAAWKGLAIPAAAAFPA